jgi:hypothetical protein
MNLVSSFFRWLMPLWLLLAAGCAMHRVPPRLALAEPLPLRVGVCPGAFDDYARDGRDLLNALRERNLFREVGPLGVMRTPPDLVLSPELGDMRPRPTLGLLTIVPWVASATVLPWFVRADREVKIRVIVPKQGADPCAGAPAAVLSTGLLPQTQVMIGWTAPLVALLPNWETTANHEFRPAVDSLVARRDWLRDLLSGR